MIYTIKQIKFSIQKVNLNYLKKLRIKELIKKIKLVLEILTTKDLQIRYKGIEGKWGYPTIFKKIKTNKYKRNYKKRHPYHIVGASVAPIMTSLPLGNFVLSYFKVINSGLLQWGDEKKKTVKPIKTYV